MKSKIRAFWILAACALLLCVAIFLLLDDPTPLPQSASDSETLYSITDISLPTLAAVQIRNPLSSFALLQTPNGIEVIAQENDHYDQMQLRTLFYAVCNLTSNRKITDPSRFSQYGLDAPEGEITLHFTDDTAERLLLLAKDPLGDNRYLYSEKENAIYLLPAQVAVLFFRSEKDFIVRTIFPLRTEADFSDIERIEVRLPQNDHEYALEPTAAGFSLVEPIQYRLPAANVRQKLLDNIVRLYADQVIATNADFSDYGLDAPFLILTLQIAGETYEACFALHPELGCLMGNPREKTVYSLEDDTAYLLVQSYIDLMGGQVFTYALGDLQTFRLTADGLPDVVISLTGNGRELTMHRNGILLSREVQNDITSALNSIPIVGQPQQDTPGQSAYRLVVQFRNGSTDILEFLSIGQGLCAVQVNEQMLFVTTMEAVQKLLASFTA